MNPPADLSAAIAELLGRAGLAAPVKAVAPCTRGGNNRIYRVETAHGVFAVKQYFRHEADTRDRLAAEYAFLNYASAAAPGAAPRPYACSPELGMALFEFVDGRPFAPGEIGAAEVDAAIDFFRALNAPSLRASAQLPVASEACFSIADHLTLVRGRIDRLLEVEPQSEIDREARSLFSRLDAFSQELSQGIRAAAGRAGLVVAAPLAPEQRCISPSDFGFNNALATQGGGIRFLDFEYAGWDDPAKTAGDFFAQLAVPVPAQLFDRFVSQIVREFPDPEALAFRAALLRPAYRIKWCCIALNVFLPVHLARRKYANPGLDETSLKRAQLAKARQILDSLEMASHGLH